MSDTRATKTDPNATSPKENMAPPQASGAQPPSPPREQEKLGNILRRVREHRGESIEEIAQYLCIRPAYLLALEGSHYEKLPADAYVIGFLRSYATYLALDGRGAVDQYRREMAGRRRKPQLSMPQPVSEGRAPTVALLIGGTLAALFVYGIWYGLSTPDKSVVEEQPPLPVAAAEAPETKKSGDLGESSVFLETATMPKVAEISTVVIEGAANPAPVEEKEEKEEKTEKKDAAQEDPLATPVPSILPPQIYGEKGKARVALSAEKESWVLITDEKGLTVFDQTLKAGDIYNVPYQKGLRLTTGNAEGISLSLDGKILPKLQPTGKVVRGVPLDPSKLKGFLSGKKDTTIEKRLLPPLEKKEEPKPEEVKESEEEND